MNPDFKFIFRNLALISLLLLSNFGMFSQKNVIKLDLVRNVLPVVFGNMPMPKLSYERTLNNKFTSQLSIEYGKYSRLVRSNSISSRTEIANIKGYGIMPEFRYYPFYKKKEVPNGLFLSGHYRYFSLVEHYFEETYDLKTYGNVNNFGINIGFKHGRALIFEYLIGFGYSKGKWENPEERNEITWPAKISDLDGFEKIRFEINLGFKFPKKEKAITKK